MSHNPNFWPLLLALLCCLAPIPAHAINMDEPARVHVQVQDAAGHPLPQAVVTLAPSPRQSNAAPLTQTTDANGRALLEMRCPTELAATQITWASRLRVERSGVDAYEQALYLFPGADFTRKAILEPPRTTRIHLRDPQGQALAGVDLRIFYTGVNDTYSAQVWRRTDELGDYQFTHPALASGLEVSVGRFSHNYGDAPDVTATLTEEELPATFPPRLLELTLLDAEGAPASGWLVARQVEATGAYGVSTGVFRTDDMTHSYTVAGLVKTGADGKITLAQAPQRLAVISPQGIPFLYPLAPKSWPDGPHHVTLRLPSVRRVQQGQLLFPDGRPAAGYALALERACSQSGRWQLDVTDFANGITMPLEQAVAVLSPGTVLRTDADGRYTLPLYSGTRTEYTVSRSSAATQFVFTPDLATRARVILAPPSVPQECRFSDYKEVRLVVVDSQGQRIPEVTVNDTPYAGKRQLLSSSDNGSQDLNGGHLFLPKEADRLEIMTETRGRKPFTQTLSIAGSADRALFITVPETQRPLTGVVLDSGGHPLPGVSISPTGPSSYGGSGWEPLGLSATTDAQGRFSFALAPESGRIDVYRFTSVTDTSGLPGWSEPLDFTAQTRDVVIRLSPVGSVRILLPASVVKAPNGVFLGGIKFVGATDFDPAAHVLRLSNVRPGQYTLRRADPDTLDYQGIALASVTVEAGKEAVLDMCDRDPALFADTPRATVEVTVTEGGRPVTGAVVTVVTKWNHFMNAPPADITDDMGRAWFTEAAGRHAVAVARVAGRLIGWTAFTFTPGQPVSISMHAARTLIVRLNGWLPMPGQPGWDRRVAWLRLKDVSPEEQRAVFDALGIPDLRELSPDTGEQAWAKLPDDGARTFLLEDLPVGYVSDLQVTGMSYPSEVLARREVVLPVGGPTLELTLQTPAKTK